MLVPIFTEVVGTLLILPFRLTLPVESHTSNLNTSKSLAFKITLQTLHWAPHLLQTLTCQF